MGAEIDLVALERLELVFVEVKTPSDSAIGIPRKVVEDRKREQIRSAAASIVARRAHT